MISGCTSYARLGDSGSSAARSTSATSTAVERPGWPAAWRACGPVRGRAASSSATTCTTPERRPWVSGPPSRSMSTSSPVTERTTSGPVTKIRPSGPGSPGRSGPVRTPRRRPRSPARSRSAGSCPTPGSWRGRSGRPRAARARPRRAGRRRSARCPRIGTRSCIARSYARTTTSQPVDAHRAAHHGGVGAEGDHAAAVDRADRGEHAASRRRRVISSTEPGSSSACEPEVRVARIVLARELRLLRRCARVLRWQSMSVVRFLSGGVGVGEGDRDVVAAEAERVVDARPGRRRAACADLGGDVDAKTQARGCRG